MSSNNIIVFLKLIEQNLMYVSKQLSCSFGKFLSVEPLPYVELVSLEET